MLSRPCHRVRNLCMIQSTFSLKNDGLIYVSLLLTPTIGLVNLSPRARIQVYPSLVWQQRPLTLAGNVEYLTCRFLFEHVTDVCLRLRAVPNPNDDNIRYSGQQSGGQTNCPFP